MQTYKKRIACLVSDQSLIQNGGIGQFVRAFCEMAYRQNWIVDLILDKKSTSPEFLATFEWATGRVYAPANPLKYTMHAQTFAFTDSINFEKETNFRQAFMDACQHHLYDLILCNVPETFAPVYSTGLHKYVPTVFYTHNESMIIPGDEKIGPYSAEYVEIYRRMYQLPGIYLGTQSMENVARAKTILDVDALCLSMPLTFEIPEVPTSYQDKSGVLWIGRWEERKNPEAYLKVIKATALPAVVITNNNGARKFRKAFEDAGITNFVIHAEVDEATKRAVIEGVKVFYNPAVKEAFCYTVIEVLGSCQVIMHDKPWAFTFRNTPNCYVVHPEMAEAAVATAYEQDPDPEGVNFQRDYAFGAVCDWEVFLEQHPVVGAPKPRGNIVALDNIVFHDYAKSLGRYLSVEDLESVYRARSVFNVTYGADATVLHKSPEPDLTPKPLKNEAILEGVDFFMA